MLESARTPGRDSQPDKLVDENKKAGDGSEDLIVTTRSERLLLCFLLCEQAIGWRTAVSIALRAVPA